MIYFLQQNHHSFLYLCTHRLSCFTTVTFSKTDQSLVNLSPSLPEWEPSWHESPRPAPHWTDSARRQQQQDNAPLKRMVKKTLGSGPNRRLGRLAEKKHTRLYKINSTYTYGVISQDVQLLHQLTDGDLLGSKNKQAAQPMKQASVLLMQLQLIACQSPEIKCKERKMRQSCQEWDSLYTETINSWWGIFWLMPLFAQLLRSFSPDQSGTLLCQRSLEIMITKVVGRR